MTTAQKRLALEKLSAQMEVKLEVGAGCYVVLPDIVYEGMGAMSSFVSPVGLSVNDAVDKMWQKLAEVLDAGKPLYRSTPASDTASGCRYQSMTWSGHEWSVGQAME